MKNFLLIILTLQFFISYPQFNHSSRNKQDIDVKYTYFSVKYSKELKNPRFCYYKLKKEYLVKNVDRYNIFMVDENVLDFDFGECYKHSGFDRGHNVPSADFTFNITANKETFYYTNMSPQYPNFNRYTWEHLEKDVRIICKNLDSIYVVTGNIFESQNKVKKEIAIPTFQYKIIVDFKSKKYIAFLLSNTNERAELDFTKDCTDLAVINSRGGVKLFINENIKREDEFFLKFIK